MMRVTRVLVILGMMLGVATATHALTGKQEASDHMHSIVSTLQQEIKSTSSELHQALKSEHHTTQAAVRDMHQQLQAQVAHIQTEMQEMQTNLEKQIKVVQDEVGRVGAHGMPTVRSKKN